MVPRSGMQQTQQAASFEFGELDNFRPVADEVLHTPPSATFLYHMKLHQGNTYRFWACLHAHSSAPLPISSTADRTVSVWDTPSTPSSGYTSYMASTSGWFSQPQTEATHAFSGFSGASQLEHVLLLVPGLSCWIKPLS